MFIIQINENSSEASRRDRGVYFQNTVEDCHYCLKLIMYMWLCEKHRNVWHMFVVWSVFWHVALEMVVWHIGIFL